MEKGQVNTHKCGSLLEMALKGLLVMVAIHKEVFTHPRHY